VSRTIVLGQQWTLAYQGRVWRPPTDVYETDDAIAVKIEIAGVSEEDFAITFSEGNLVVSGVRADPAAKLGYRQMEISYGEFHAEVFVPLPVDVDCIEATYQNGFLHVTLPKRDRRSTNADDQCG
jgi:HSP20 family molecular chaperone IbpA